MSEFVVVVVKGAVHGDSCFTFICLFIPSVLDPKTYLSTHTFF